MWRTSSRRRWDLHAGHLGLKTVAGDAGVGGGTAAEADDDEPPVCVDVTGKADAQLSAISPCCGGILVASRLREG